MQEISIVGAGLVGCLQALFLSKRHDNVSIYDYRTDYRNIKETKAYRSINLAISHRGFDALDRVGIPREDVVKKSVPMLGRMVHKLNGEQKFYWYDEQQKKAIYSIRRKDLGSILLNVIEKCNNVNMFFEHRFLHFDAHDLSLIFEDRDNTHKVIRTQRIFGIDGAFSKVRSLLHSKGYIQSNEECLPYAYKEFIISPENGKYLHANALHIWPRGDFMFIALPNIDKSFTGTLFMKNKGVHPSFESLGSRLPDIQKFFIEYFSDFSELIPDYAQQYLDNPLSFLYNVTCDKFHYKDKVVLLGDAGHSMAPFYGQGMNAGFEDCVIFDDIFQQMDCSWSDTFRMFSESRKKNTDAILEMTMQNHKEMSSQVVDARFILANQISSMMQEKFPEQWFSIYNLVTFSSVPYSDVLHIQKRQKHILEQILSIENIQNAWNQDCIYEKMYSLMKV